MIHVCYGLYDKDGRYSKFTGTSMLSILENYNAPPRSLTVHILHDNTLTLDNYSKFIYIAGQYNQLVKFYNVEKLCADKIAEIREMFPKVSSARVTLGTMYRLLICDLFDAEIDKVIYLDSDIIVNLDITDLWNVRLGDKPLAAVAESVADPRGFPQVARAQHLVTENFVKYEDYFNAAVLLLNLVRLRKESDTIKAGMKFIAEGPQFFCFDQDIMNYCFTKEYIKLPDKFDRFVARALEKLSPQTHKPERVIYHYTGSDPTLNMNDAMNRLYMKYFVKTPWFDVDAIGHLYEGVRKIYVEQKNLAVQITSVMSGKTRAFFVSPKNVEPCKKIFGINAKEELIVGDSPESIQKMINSLKKSNGKKIFFILAPKYAAMRQVMSNAGLVDGRDFINAAMFLSDVNGVPLNSYPLVKLL